VREAVSGETALAAVLQFGLPVCGMERAKSSTVGVDRKIGTDRGEDRQAFDVGEEGIVPEQFRCPHCEKPLPIKLVREIASVAARETGSKGGKKLATARGPEYFRKLQKKRKTRSGGTHGGRPSTKASTKK
jgi:hypothetical protein